MMSAFTAERDHVLVEDIESAIGELGWTDFAARKTSRPRRSAAHGADQTQSLQRASRAMLSIGGPEPLAETGKHPAPTRPLARLVVVADGRNLGELPLREGRTIIGRTPDNDLQIDSRFVSRHHCQIITKPNACIVEDLNSTNGIMVKSKRVRRHNLNDGDVITIGRHDLIYIDERSLQRTGQTGNHKLSIATDAPAEGHGETQVI
jgi:pSer/pThr/pTyr-binding forkhead associated (FHA) protein